MSAQNIQIKAKKISELENLQDVEKISNSYIIVSYTENGAKENYKVKIQNLFDSINSNEMEYNIRIFTNGVILTSQSPGPYIKDTIVSFTFKALDNYKLTDNSYFVINCEVISWDSQSGQLKIKITGTDDPIINILGSPLIDYIVDGLNFIEQDARILTGDNNDTNTRFGDVSLDETSQEINLSLNINLLKKIKQNTINTSKEYVDDKLSWSIV